MPSMPRGRRTNDATTKVRTYLSGLPAATRKPLQKLRETIRSAAPDATEAFSYGIPAFKLAGRPLVYDAAWREHYSLYPMTGAIQRAFASQLRGYETSKGTIRFPLSKPVPTALVKRLIKSRVAEVQAKRKGR